MLELDIGTDESSTSSRQLLEQAEGILAKSEDDPAKLPDILLELLNIIIRPLFSASHPQLTPAGRKPAYATQPTLPHAVPVSLHQEKPWHNSLTIPVLKVVLKSYLSLPSDRIKEVLQSQFPLLVPPVLNIIDDMSTSWKADGYVLLDLLCEAVIAADSDILKRTGLTDVFFDAIKPSFMLLPTLTPEDESLLVLERLYPASLALVNARFNVSISTKGNVSVKGQTSTESEDDKKQKYLKLLLRHGLLASLSHLGAGTSTSFIPLTTKLVEQLSPLVKTMGLTAVTDLHNILPMLRNLLSDPFGSASPELLLATLASMKTFIQVCEPRITSRWWPECLRGLVACWCNIIDEEEDAKNKEALAEVKSALIETTELLGTVVKNEEWAYAKKRLLAEAEDLDDLFEKP